MNEPSLANKLKREVAMVAEGTVDGIAEAARDAWSHKGNTALKVGGAALFGAGATLAAAELALPPLAITAGGVILAASQGKELIKSGKEVAHAMKDCWNNPDHCEAGKDKVKETVAPLAMDAALFTAGGMAGSVAGRAAAVSVKEAGLMKRLEQYHQETAEHSMRVAQYAKLTTNELGLSSSVQREAYHAGKMHDVGKLEIPREILNKPSELNAAEKAVMHQHPKTSEEMLAKIPYGGALKNVANDAGAHHEWVNGKGYPNELGETHLSAVAKTLAPVDVFDAMTSGRAYAREGRLPYERSALDEVKKKIDSGVGAQFDRKSVQALWEVPASRMISVLESSERRPPVPETVLKQFEGARFGRLLDVLGGSPASAEETRLANLLNQIYQKRAP